MTLNTRIKEKGVNATMIFFFFMGIIIYSVTSNAQGTKKNTGFDPVNQVDNADKKIRFARNANMEARAFSLEAAINSPYAELKPTLSPDGARLYFSRSYHPNNSSGVEDPEDIWYSNYDKISDTWSYPLRMPGALNNAGPNFINSVSITGDTIILGNQYGRKGKMKPGLSYSVNVRGQWSEPISINTQNDYNMSDHANAFVSLKSGVIIKSIQRSETFGHRDLYVSFWNGELATEPINMGGVLNTEMEESSPYLAADNRTLYFASKGHAGYGGLDIYVTHRLDESWTNWSEPENLGPAVNTAMDDEFFNITHCGKYATFSRQVSIHNVDLFEISIQDLFVPKILPQEMNARNKLVSASFH